MSKMPKWFLLGNRISQEIEGSESVAHFREDFGQEEVAAALAAFTKILEQSRKNFAVLGLISDTSFKDLDELDPKLGFSLLARELYHQPSIVVVNKFKQQLAKPTTTTDADLPFEGIHEELEAIRVFVANLFDEKIGTPIYQIPRCVFHIMCKFRTQANTCMDQEYKGFLSDISNRLAQVSDDVTNVWELDDLRMIIKGYASWVLDRTKKGLIPPSTEGIRRYTEQAYALFNEERDPLLPNN